MTVWLQEGPSGVVRESDGPLRVHLPGGSAVELDVLGGDLRIRALAGGEQLVVRPASQVAVWLSVDSAEGRATADLYADDREFEREHPEESTHIADHVLAVLQRLDEEEEEEP